MTDSKLLPSDQSISARLIMGARAMGVIRGFEEAAAEMHKLAIEVEKLEKDSKADIDRMERAAIAVEDLTKQCAYTGELLSLCIEMCDWLRPEVTKEPDRSFFWKLNDLIKKATNT